jgi:hypothetical protein
MDSWHSLMSGNSKRPKAQKETKNNQTVIIKILWSFSNEYVILAGGISITVYHRAISEFFQGNHFSEFGC